MRDISLHRFLKRTYVLEGRDIHECIYMRVRFLLKEQLGVYDAPVQKCCIMSNLYFMSCGVLATPIIFGDALYVEVAHFFLSKLAKVAHFLVSLTKVAH